MKEDVILQALQRKDADVMNYIINKYSRLLWPISTAVLQHIGSVQDIEECIADTFIHLWEHPEKYDPQRGSLKSYLCILVRCKSIDRYRAISRHSTLSLEDVVAAEEFGLNDLIRKHAFQELQCALDGLEEPAREILIRRYYYDQKPRQIALAMDMTVKQVDNLLYRTKKVLRNTLTEKGVTP